MSEKKSAAEDGLRSERIKKNRRTVIIIASALLLLVLIFGITVGGVVLVRDKRAVLKYGGTMADEGVVSYLVATYKKYYMASVGDARDTEEYWSGEVGDTTRGELLRVSTEEYVRSVMVGAYLFDRYTDLSDSERAAIDRATGEILDFRAGGDEGRFNELSAPMGFDFDDFCRATELIYKSEMAAAAIYGEGGAALGNLSDPAVLAQCNAYFAEYSRVKLIYIDTKEYIVKDSEGKLEIGDTGEYLTQYLTAAEILSRSADIAEIRRLIEGARTGVGEEMSPEYFRLMQDKYNITNAYNESGYYLSERSAFSEGFAEDTTEYMPDGGYKAALYKMLAAAVESVSDMNEGEYLEIEGDFGVLFIYKCEKEESAYLYSGYGIFFHDFFSDAAGYLYENSVSTLSKDVDVREKYYEIDPVKIPYNSSFIARIER